MSETKKRPYLLLIENDRSIQRIFETVLDGCDWVVVASDNADAAIKEWKTGIYAGILVDLDIPQVSCFDLTFLIRRIEREKGWKPIPIVGIAGVLSDTDRTRGMQAGMNGFITKPVRPEQLCETIGRYLQR